MKNSLVIVKSIAFRFLNSKKLKLETEKNIQEILNSKNEERNKKLRKIEEEIERPSSLEKAISNSNVNITKENNRYWFVNSTGYKIEDTTSYETRHDAELALLKAAISHPDYAYTVKNQYDIVYVYIKTRNKNVKYYITMGKWEDAKPLLIRFKRPAPIPDLPFYI